MSGPVTRARARKRTQLEQNLPYDMQRKILRSLPDNLQSRVYTNKTKAKNETKKAKAALDDLILCGNNVFLTDRRGTYVAVNSASNRHVIIGKQGFTGVTYRAQIKRGHDIVFDKPVSRQHVNVLKQALLHSNTGNWIILRDRNKDHHRYRPYALNKTKLKLKHGPFEKYSYHDYV